MGLWYSYTCLVQCSVVWCSVVCTMFNVFNWKSNESFELANVFMWFSNASWCTITYSHSFVHYFIKLQTNGTNSQSNIILSRFILSFLSFSNFLLKSCTNANETNVFFSFFIIRMKWNEIRRKNKKQRN